MWEMDLHRVARLMAAGHGGQVLVSETTRALLDGVGLHDLGGHRLKALLEPIRLYQLEIDGGASTDDFTAAPTKPEPSGWPGAGRSPLLLWISRPAEQRPWLDARLGDKGAAVVGETDSTRASEPSGVAEGVSAGRVLHKRRR